jgi:hypothetical protein
MNNELQAETASRHRHGAEKETIKIALYPPSSRPPGNERAYAIEQAGDWENESVDVYEGTPDEIRQQIERLEEISRTGNTWWAQQQAIVANRLRQALCEHNVNTSARK